MRKIASTSSSGNAIMDPRGPKKKRKISTGPLLLCFLSLTNFFTLFQMPLNHFNLTTFWPSFGGQSAQFLGSKISSCRVQSTIGQGVWTR